MKIQVLIRLKPGVLDVQGKAVEHSLKGVGYDDISDVRVGRLVELEVDGSDFAAARQKAEEICKKVLANMLVEHYEIKQAA